MYIEDLEIRIKKFSIEWSEWDILYKEFLSLIQDIKIQVEKNQLLTTRVIELETTIEKYNSTIVGSEAYFKQQLEILARSTIKNQSIIYTSYKREMIETQTELQSLRLKIGRIEAMKFNKSAVHGKISYEEIIDKRHKEIHEYDFMKKRSIGGSVAFIGASGASAGAVAGAALGTANTSIDVNNSMNVSNQLVASGQNRSTIYRPTNY